MGVKHWLSWRKGNLRVGMTSALCDELMVFAVSPCVAVTLASRAVVASRFRCNEIALIVVVW